MIKYCIFFLLLFLPFFLFSQSPFRVKIIDAKTKLSIEGAIVFIEEIPIGDKTSDINGFVAYQNIPSDRKVNLNVRKIGYAPVKKSIVANADLGPDNNILVELQKESLSPQKIIWGELSDAEGNDVIEALIELNLAGTIFSTKSDESGNYRFKIEESVFAGLKTFRVEVKHEKCDKVKKEINNISERIINCDLALSCTDETSLNDIRANKINKIESYVQKVNIGELEVTLVKCVRKGSSVECMFTLFSNSKDENMWIYGHVCELYDDEGTKYGISGGQIAGNADNRNEYSSPAGKVIAGIKTKASVTFKEFPRDKDFISLLIIDMAGDNIAEEKLEFRGIRIK
jgi:hypothetical protein